MIVRCSAAHVAVLCIELKWLRLVGSIHRSLLQKRPIKETIKNKTTSNSTHLCVLQCALVCCSVLQCVAVCCSVLQCVAVCFSVLQCVAACCSVL